MNNKLVIDFCKAVRESTIKRLKVVPEGYENWKVSPGTLSFAEIAKHIIDLDIWLLEKIKNPDTKSIDTESAIISYCDRKRYEELIINLEEMLEKKIDFINTLDEEKLTVKIYDDAYNSEVSISWLILRRNIDHEIHHRGQIATYIRVLKDRKVVI